MAAIGWLQILLGRVAKDRVLHRAKTVAGIVALAVVSGSVVNCPRASVIERLTLPAFEPSTHREWQSTQISRPIARPMTSAVFSRWLIALAEGTVASHQMNRLPESGTGVGL
jgi:hypothetical protein